MDPLTIINFVAAGLSALKQVMEVGKEVSPQVMVLVNAIMELVSGDVDKGSVTRLREAITALNEELLELEEDLIPEETIVR